MLNKKKVIFEGYIIRLHNFYINFKKILNFFSDFMRTLV